MCEINRFLANVRVHTRICITAFVRSSELEPIPPPQAGVFPHPRNQRGRGHTLLRVRGWVGRNLDAWRKSSVYSVYSVCITMYSSYTRVVVCSKSTTIYVWNYFDIYKHILELNFVDNYTEGVRRHMNVVVVLPQWAHLPARNPRYAQHWRSGTCFYLFFLWLLNSLSLCLRQFFVIFLTRSQALASNYDTKFILYICMSLSEMCFF